MAEEEQEKVKDVAMVQEFLSAYLYGLYTLIQKRLNM